MLNNLNTEPNEELPDLTSLGFNEYEQNMINKGFSHRLTAGSDQ